jgi:hypothetical protein
MQFRVLVVYYSRATTTELAAHVIGRALGADLDAIIDRVGPGGRLTNVRTSIGSPEAFSTRSIADYDLVVVGAPVFGSTPANPIHHLLIECRTSARALAFFCTGTGAGHDSALARLARIARRDAVATLSLSRDDFDAGRLGPLAERFAAEIRESFLATVP